ncbi:MAG UNVERIFIED_CONTAM: hypothetical protein LVR29_00410 [Microcystis novacekii LVE1205-3]
MTRIQRSPNSHANRFLTLPSQFPRNEIKQAIATNFSRFWSQPVFGTIPSVKRR